MAWLLHRMATRKLSGSRAVAVAVAVAVATHQERAGELGLVTWCSKARKVHLSHMEVGELKY